MQEALLVLSLVLSLPTAYEVINFLLLFFASIYTLSLSIPMQPNVTNFLLNYFVFVSRLKIFFYQEFVANSLFYERKI